MCVKTYWLRRRISMRSFLMRYRNFRELSLNWSDSLAVGYYVNLIGDVKIFKLEL